jgi:hypothetical protein
MTFQWGKVVLKDYSTCCTWVVITTLLFMYEGYRVEGTGTNRMIIGAAILAGAGLFSFVVHSMKKSASRKRVAQA